MSGGYFNYRQHYIGDIISPLKKLIRNNNSKKLDEYGQVIGNFYPDDVIDKFKETVETLILVAAMVERIDYLVSGDDGIDSFLERWKEDID